MYQDVSLNFQSRYRPFSRSQAFFHTWMAHNTTPSKCSWCSASSNYGAARAGAGRTVGQHVGSIGLVGCSRFFLSISLSRKKIWTTHGPFFRCKLQTLSLKEPAAWHTKKKDHVIRYGLDSTFQSFLVTQVLYCIIMPPKISAASLRVLNAGYEGMIRDH